MSSGTSRRSVRVGAVLVGAGLLVYTVTAAVPPLDNNDIWIHLTTGRLIVEEVSVPRSDRYSFTAAGNRYVAHEWLAAAVYAMAERAAGDSGVVVVAKVIPTVVIVAMLFGIVAVTRVPWGLALPVLVLTLTVLRYRILARPELLALPILLAMVALLWRDRESARSGGHSRAVFWLVPLEGLWANLHGSFPLGIALVLVFALAETARRLLASRDRRAHRVRVVGVAGALAAAFWLASLEPRAFGVAAAVTVVVFAGLFAADGIRPLFDDARAAASDPLRLIGLAAGMTVVAAINPLGTEIYAFPFEFTASENTITRVVNEWKPLLGSQHLDRSLHLMSYWAFLGFACAAVAIAAWRGRLGRLEVGLLLAFGLLPLRHVRWMAWFAIVVTPPLLVMLAAARHPAGPSDRSDRVVRVVAFGLAGCGLVFVGLAIATAARTDPDPWIRLTLALAITGPALALALGVGSRIPLVWGTAGAGLATLALTTVAFVHGIPDRAGTTPRPWSGVGMGPGFGPSRQAGPATEFLREAEISGHLLTEYEWAGLAIHELWPRVTVFIDSRSEVYGEELVAEFRRIKNLEESARRGLDRYSVDLVLVREFPYPSESSRNQGLLSVVEVDPRWGLLFVDDQSILYARRDLARELPILFERFAPRRFHPNDPGVGHPKYQEEVRRAIARAPHSAFLRFVLASSLRAQGRPSEALAELRAGWKANPRFPAVSQLAGEIAAARGDVEQARRWFQRALSVAPHWGRARESLNALAPK
ncbi:MAG: tetratricopeptide repeat protein [Myxococcota bacterium]